MSDSSEEAVLPWDEITLTTKVYLRTESLAGLLDSVPGYIDNVLIADDGETSERAHLYQQDWPFSLDVIDLEYNAGVGAGRARLADEIDTEFMLMVDPDHRIPPNVDVLARQLVDKPNIGGIAGLLIEDGCVGGACHDFIEARGGDILVRGRRDTTVETVAGHPLVPFNFVPQAALIRREALEDYSWDSYYTSAKDHLDFMLGQWKAGWQWAVSPTVIFGHVEHSHEEYRTSRQDLLAWYQTKQYTLDKWGYDQIVLKENYAAFQHRGPVKTVKQALPMSLQVLLNDFGDAKNKYLGYLRD